MDKYELKELQDVVLVAAEAYRAEYITRGSRDKHLMFRRLTEARSALGELYQQREVTLATLEKVLGMLGEEEAAMLLHDLYSELEGTQ
jgi:hypothetical protein